MVFIPYFDDAERSQILAIARGDAELEYDSELYNKLYDYFTSIGEMPYGVAKARTGDPDFWIAEQLARMMTPELMVVLNATRAGTKNASRLTKQLPPKRMTSRERSEAARRNSAAIANVDLRLIKKSPEKVEQSSSEEVLSRMGHAQPERTVRELRSIVGLNDHDRELVQHAADLIEVLSKLIRP